MGPMATLVSGAAIHLDKRESVHMAARHRPAVALYLPYVPDCFQPTA